MMNSKISRGLELSQIAMSYKITGEDKYFEELWNEVKPFAFKIGQKYINTISKENMEELAMVCLYDCCRCLKEGTNVLTYYGRILVNRYHDAYKRPRTRGNEVLNNQALSLDATYESDGGEQYIALNPSTVDDIFFIEDFYEECKLGEQEIIFVDLLNIGYKQAEIMEKLKMEKTEYKKMLKGIRKKVMKNYDFGTI